MADTKQVYDIYREKHGLPPFEEVHKFLELTLENEHLALVEIRKKALEKLGRFLEILDPIVQPETNAISMYETASFTDAERQLCFEQYKRIMALARQCDLAGLTEKDEAISAFINSFFLALPEIRAALASIIAKQISTWEKQDDTTENMLGYLG